jgi:hypothetical protein
VLLLCEVPSETNNFKTFAIHDGRELYIVLSSLMWIERRAALRDARRPVVPPLRKFFVTVHSPGRHTTPPALPLVTLRTENRFASMSTYWRPGWKRRNGRHRSLRCVLTRRFQRNVLEEASNKPKKVAHKTPDINYLPWKSRSPYGQTRKATSPPPELGWRSCWQTFSRATLPNRVITVLLVPS